jgi:dolichyl-phosphate beta-glucosyltransferase
MSAVPVTAANQPIVIVPCFNEEHRLDEHGFLDLVGSSDLQLLFVNDGSNDGTSTILERLKRKNDSIGLLELPYNSGKAEAVRQGLLQAVEAGAPIVGYFDADLATPGSELIRMIGLLEAQPELTAVFGSRIARLGSQIERSAVRHYTGRVFATVASIALGVAVYDTQCGAKVFRVNDNLRAAIQIPFRSAWSFDVLLCQRLLDGVAGLPGLPVASFVEMPLQRWTDVAGSKVDVTGSLAALADVVVVGVSRRRRGRRQRTPGSAHGGPAPGVPSLRPKSTGD